MVKNVLTVTSVFALSLTLISHAEAGKKKTEEPKHEIYNPDIKGRVIRKDGKYNRALARHTKKRLDFNSDSDTESNSTTESDTNTESTSKK